MFERASVSQPRLTPPTLADAVLLRPVDPPDAGAAWSTSARPVLLAVRGGGWASARVLAWTWNPSGRPVVWRCVVDLGDDRVGWYAYDARLVRPAPGD